MHDDAERQLPAAAADSIELIHRGMERHQRGELESAEGHYRSALEVAPEHPDALHWLGVLLCGTDRREQGRALIERSIALVPDFAGYHNNYGNTLLAAGALADAERAYRRCLDLESGQPAVWCNLGICLRKAGRPVEAVHAFEQALSVNAGQGESYRSLVDILEAQDKFDEVAAAYEESFDALAGYEPAFAQLARLYYLAGRVDDAARVYRRWLAANPEHPAPRHMLAACTGEAVPARTADAMVRATFDGFADSFDQVLGKLGYQTPQRICEQAAQLVDTSAGHLTIADVGCGTGLCGPWLRPWAASLVGVDLSPRMLDKARARDIYDSLEEAELVTWLRQHPGAFDLVLCADTLCYFGQLDEVFAAARAALRPGGRFVFSIESADDEDAVLRFRLYPSGRYAHRSAFVEARLIAASLTLLGRSDVTLRQELGKPVAGSLFSAGV
ncbi:MAG: tetratricopeptide repeat protein [Gammaproteobacteria bacterium]|jgi:predicted TPR repeat methyltransferase|nr:tetratricopeptide repeat protein [Gammaproteobacteria bacterium]